MKFSENWLRTLVDPPIAGAELASALTMAGLEVESMEAAAPKFTGVVVGEILEVRPHAKADRLVVCRVAAGASDPVQVVCGAPNAAVGIKVPCALPGAQLPGMKISASRVRDMDSNGMLCSARELGLNDDDSGLLLLSPLARPGDDVRKVLELDDTLFTLKITPNRGDCLSVYGIAREVAAITATTLRAPEFHPQEAAIAKTIPVKVAESAACPRYCGRVIVGVNVRAATPEWMARRLARSGVRSHGAVVDVTNYVMLEMGQPLHAFDCERIVGAIVVRYAEKGATLKLINGEQVSLDRDVLVIADQRRALALAGIMGGEASAVNDETRDLFLESAFFAPEVMAGKARRLNLVTDSAYRFERGVDFMATRDALERATMLIVEICGGQAGAVTEVSGQLPAREPITLRATRLSRVLGITLSETEVSSMLRRLQLGFSSQKERFHVLPPSFRFDLKIEEDLIEELARLHGYDRIPARANQAPVAILPCPEKVRSEFSVKSTLAARDYQEIVSYSFIDPKSDFAAPESSVIEIMNPLSSDMAVMRGNLIAGLLACLRANVTRKQTRVRIFESGRCFFREGDAYRQPEKLAGLVYGEAYPEQWGVRSRPVDFHDMKADIEALFSPREVRFEASTHPALHPGKSSLVLFSETTVGYAGQLHPELQKKYDLPQSTLVFELDLASLRVRELPAYEEISKYPSVSRDLAVVVAESLEAGEILNALKLEAPAQVRELALFDVYRGEPLKEKEKSLAFRILLQDTQKTLNDEDVEAIISKLVSFLQRRFHARLRQQGD